MKINFNIQKIKKKFDIKSDIKINKVSSIINPKNKSLIYILKINQTFISDLSKIKEAVILTEKDLVLNNKILKNNIIIKCSNPKLQFIKILNKMLIPEIKTKYKENKINRKSKIHKSTIIEPYVFIDENVTIGKNCIIKTGVKIFSGVKIGNNTIIGPNSVIGYKGFGIDRHLEKKQTKIPMKGNPIKMKHFGGVVIGNNVDIGSINTICSGAIDPTIIEDYVVTDDHVHIAHNCFLKKGCALTASVQLSGGVQVGENTWVGPSSSIMQKVKIGKKNIIGIATTIYRDTPNNTKWLGNPARKVFV